MSNLEVSKLADTWIKNNYPEFVYDELQYRMLVRVYIEAYNNGYQEAKSQGLDA
jgi:hypothetical protein